MSWYSTNKSRAFSLFSVQGLRPERTNFFEQDFSSLLNGEPSTAFFGPPPSSKSSYSTIRNHSFRNFIGCYHSGHSSPFLDNNGMILGIIQLDHCLSTTTIICAIAKGVHVVLEGELCHFDGGAPSSCSCWFQWGVSLDSYI